MSRAMRLRLLQNVVLPGIVSLAGIAGSAAAQERTYKLDIPAESLSKALRDFGQATHQQLVFTDDLTVGKAAPPLKGNYSAKSALDLLLKDSGLSVEKTPTGALVLHKASSNQAATSIGEVVVTANKRAEILRNVAMSMSVVSGTDLARNQILDLEDLQASVPGLAIQGGGPGGGERIIIRGLNSGGDGANVTTVVDDVPLSYSLAETDGGNLASDFDTYDLNRIEVLKGPQGTLYGADAEGGLIKYVTNPPDPNAYHLGMEAGEENVAHGGLGGDVKGYANIPLMNGTAAIRASGYYESMPGWISDPVTGQNRDNAGHRYGGRFSALWRPIPNLSIRATAFLQERNADGVDAVSVYGNSNPSNRFGFVNGYNYYQYNADITRNRLNFYSLDIDYDLHWASLQSITSYGSQHEFFDQDSPTLAGTKGAGTSAFQQQINALGKFNQEFRISSNPGDQLFRHDLDWQFGVFYTHEISTYDQNINLVSSQGAVTPGYFLDAVLPMNFNEEAIYGDLTYHFTRKFDVEVGGRFSSDGSHSQVAENGSEVGGKYIVLPYIKTSDTSGTFSFAPRYHLTDDILAYVRIASGFRPGGPELPVAGEPAVVPTKYGADSTINYEAGVKSQFFDGKVTIDLDGFYIDWSDIQVISTVKIASGANFSFTGNAGSAVSEGAEFNFGWRPVQGLRFGFAGAYTDAHLTQNAPGIGGLSGQALAYVPVLSTTLNGDYEWPSYGASRGFVGFDWSHIGDRYSNFGTNPANGHQEIPSYETVSARTGVRYGSYTFELYGKNLTDAKGITYFFPASSYGGKGEAYLIRPLTVGIRVSSSF